MKPMINLRLQQEKFIKAVNRLIKATDGNTADILKEATTDFTEFTAKATEPSKGSKNIEAKKYKREIIELASKGRNRKEKGMFCIYVKHAGKPKKIIYSNTKRGLAKYVRISFRGLSRAGWYLNQQSAVGKALSTAEQQVLSKSPMITAKQMINQIKATGKSVSITNNTPNIEKYAQYAMTSGYSAAAKKLDRLRRKFIKEQEAIPL